MSFLESDLFGICLKQGENQHFDLPVKKKSDISTIMYTSGTTGDPKGVMISNKSIISLIAGVQRLLESVNEEVVFLSFFRTSNVLFMKALR